jgi:hypothetical protein
VVRNVRRVQLCLNTPAADLILDSVQLSTSVEPLASSVSIRRVRAETVDHHRAGDPNLLPTIATLGSLPDFADPDSTGRPLGDYSTSVAGTALTQSCDASRHAVENLNQRIPSEGFTELLVTLKAGPGGLVDGATIRYSVGDTPYILRIPWTMILCGSDPAVAASCGPHPSL